MQDVDRGVEVHVSRGSDMKNNNGYVVVKAFDEDGWHNDVDADDAIMLFEKCNRGAEEVTENTESDGE